MSPTLAAALALLATYLLGAIPFALVAGKLKGLDLRQHGSGNVGATNALRVLGKRWGIAVLLLDLGKGALPVLLVPRLFAALELAPPAWLGPALAAAAIVGHVFPIYLRFKGGKGVATSAGAFLALHPAALGVAAGAFFVVLAAFRIVSLSSLVAAAMLPLAALLLDGWEVASGVHRGRTILFVLMATLVWVRHRQNVARLIKGQEPRIGQKAANTADSPAPTTPENAPTS